MDALSFSGTCFSAMEHNLLRWYCIYGTFFNIRDVCSGESVLLLLIDGELFITTNISSHYTGGL